MILLDTHVVSEVMKARPAEAVVAWLNGQDSEKLYVSSITIGEIAYGLRLLPDGKRRSGLRQGSNTSLPWPLISACSTTTSPRHASTAR